MDMTVEVLKTNSTNHVDLYYPKAKIGIRILTDDVYLRAVPINAKIQGIASPVGV